MSRMIVGSAAAASLLVLAACGGTRDEEHVPGETAGRTAYEELAIASDTSQGYRSPEAAPVTPVQGTGTLGGPLTATGNLRGIAENYPPGTVTITEESPTATRFIVAITRYAAGSPLELSIVRGDCAASGQVVTTVGQMRVADSGMTTENFTVQLPTRTLMDGQHSIRVANPVRAGDPLLVLACAAIPAAS